MDTFISWSGEKSHAAAEALRRWLPKAINDIKPWVSSADLEKGSRWPLEIASKLEAAKAGIICLTPNNLTSPWILFEAGALAKKIEGTRVCTFLIDLQPTDVTGPLSLFQATRATKEDVLQLTKTLNKALGEKALPIDQIEEVFEVLWPDLESKLKKLPGESSSASVRRSDRDLLEELLTISRGIARAIDAGRRAELGRLTNEALRALTPMEEKVIRMRFGLDEDAPLTSEQIAEAFGVFAQEINAVEDRALRKLRHLPRRKRSSAKVK